MRRILFVLLIIALSGCAPAFTWVKSGASASDFYRAKSYCDALSTGATPMDYANPGSSMTYQSGTVYGSGGGSGTYSGTSTTYHDNTAQTLANLGQSVRRQQMFNDCMRGQGFVPQQEQTRSSTSSYKTKREGVGSPYSRDSSSLDNEQQWEESAVGQVKASVNFDKAEFFSQPSLDAKKLGVIARGEVVEIIAEANSFWFKIRYKWQEGYVMQPWVTPVNRSGASGVGSN